MSETVTTHRNLLATSGAGPAPTLLPAPVTELAPDADHDAVVAAVIADPAASLGWAVLAEESLTRRTAAADVGNPSAACVEGREESKGQGRGRAWRTRTTISSTR